MRKQQMGVSAQDLGAMVQDQRPQFRRRRQQVDVAAAITACHCPAAERLSYPLLQENWQLLRNHVLHRTQMCPMA